MGKRACEHLLHQLYQDEDDPDEAIPAYSALTQVVEALEVNFDLPNYREMEERKTKEAKSAKVVEEELKVKVRMLSRTIKTMSEESRKSQATEYFETGSSNHGGPDREEFEIGDTVVTGISDKSGRIIATEIIDGVINYKAKMHNGDAINTIAERMKSKRQAQGTNDNQNKGPLRGEYPAAQGRPITLGRYTQSPRPTANGDQGQTTSPTCSDMGSWEQAPTQKRTEYNIWHPELTRHVKCKYVCEIPFVTFAGGTWKPGAMQVRGCKQITRGYFAECINSDPMGDQEKPMLYIQSAAPFTLSEVIPIWVQESTKVRIYEPVVMPPISSITQMTASLKRAGSDTRMMAKTILKELAQSIEHRCEKWSTKVAKAIAEVLK